MKPPTGTTDIAVVFALPFPLYVPDTIADGKFEQIRPEFYIAGDPPAGIHLIRRMRNGVAINSPMELEGGDPFGRFSLSDVQVRFNLEASPKLADLDHAEVVERAISALNRLIEHYRDLADQSLIRRVSAADLGHFTIRYLQAGKPIHDLAYATGHGPLRGREPNEVELLDAHLRNRLQATVPPDLFRELELRMHQLFNERDYRGAVIEAGILFECWLKAFVRRQPRLPRGLRRQGTARRDHRGSDRGDLSRVAQRFGPQAARSHRPFRAAWGRPEQRGLLRRETRPLCPAQLRLSAVHPGRSPAPDAVAFAEAPEVEGGNLQPELAKMGAQFARPVGFAGVPHHLNRGVQHPTIGLDKRRA